MKAPAKAPGPPPTSTVKAEKKSDPVLSVAYEQRIQAAYEACEANNGERARELLANCPPALRGWEWYYCQRKSRGWMTTIPDSSKTNKVFAQSADGKLLASADDSAVRLWDGKQWNRIGTHARVAGIAFSADSKQVLSVGADDTLRVWDIARASPVRSFELPLAKATCRALSPDGRWVAAGTASGTVKVWDATEQTERAKRELRAAIRNLAFSADGTKIVATVGNGVSVLDWRTGAKGDTFERQLSIPSPLAISPDGRNLASAEDNVVTIHGVTEAAGTYVLRGHTAGVSAAAFSHDGGQLATGGWDRTLNAWDTATGRFAASYEGHTGEITRIWFSPDDRFVNALSRDGKIYTWRVRDGFSDKDVGVGGGIMPEGIWFSDDAKVVYAVVDTGNSTRGEVVLDSEILFPMAAYRGVLSVSPHGDKILQLIDGALVVKSATQNKVLAALTLDPSFAHDVVLGDNDRHFVIMRRTQTGHWIINGVHYPPRTDTAMGIWDNTKAGLRWHVGWEGGSEFQNAMILPGSGDVIGVIRLVENPEIMFRTSQLVRILSGLTGETLYEFPATSFRIHPKGDLVAILGKGVIDFLRLRANERIAPLRATNCWFDMSGRFVATSAGQLATIWELSPRTKVCEFAANSAIAFSPDGRRAVAAVGNEVRIMDARTGNVLLRIHGRGDNFAFSPDGRTIASGTGKVAKFWVADPPADGAEKP